MKKRVHRKFEYQKRYFILKNNDYHLYYSKVINKDLPNISKEFIDLRNIEQIGIPKKSKDVNKGYEFHLIEKDKNWILKVKSIELRRKWLNCIKNEWNKLKFTLIRYCQILSNIRVYESFQDYFRTKKYSLANLINDHIHVCFICFF